MSALTDLFTNIANAIRSKKGTTDKINAQNFASEIESIESGSGGLGHLENYKLKVKKSLYYEFFDDKSENLDEPLTNLNSGEVTDMRYMFYRCTQLKSVPLFNTSSATDMEYMFNGCSSLTSIPNLDTSNVTKMNYMFSSCSKLTTIPELNTSKVTSMTNMFSGCSSLTSIPNLDTSNVTSTYNMFSGCKNLTTIPELNTSKVTNMGSMFSECHNLVSIPTLDTSNINKLEYAFNQCRSITTIPLLDTSKVTSMVYAFSGCTNLTTIPALDVSNITNNSGYSSTFMNCTSLKSILMTGIKAKLNIAYSTAYEREDLVTILNNLVDVGKSKTLTMGETNLAKLTEEDIAIATEKGWTLA